MKNKKGNVAVIAIIIVIAAVAAVGAGLALTKKSQGPAQQQTAQNQITTSQPENNQQQPVQKEDSKSTLKSCASSPCENGYTCYNSRFSGLGENGSAMQTNQEGDLLCHKNCSTDSDCAGGKCQTVEMKGGDVVIDYKICFEK